MLFVIRIISNLRKIAQSKCACVKLLDKILYQVGTTHSHDKSCIFASSPMLNPTYHNSTLGAAYMSTQTGATAARSTALHRLSQLNELDAYTRRRDTYDLPGEECQPASFEARHYFVERASAIICM
jgi:hypothetical protein